MEDIASAELSYPTSLIQFFFSFDEVSERFYTQNQSGGVRNDQDVPFHVILCENVCEGTNVSHHP
jgi:hypothetical protein